MNGTQPEEREFHGRRHRVKQTLVKRRGVVALGAIARVFTGKLLDAGRAGD
jgi:hypothetical protein